MDAWPALGLARVELWLDGSAARLEKLRSEEFWDRVMSEIHEALHEAGAMTAPQILPVLKLETVRGGAECKELLNPRTLHKKFVDRAKQG